MKKLIPILCLVLMLTGCTAPRETLPQESATLPPM